MLMSPFSEVPQNKPNCFPIFRVTPCSQSTEVFFNPHVIIFQNLLTQLPTDGRNNLLPSISPTATVVRAPITLQTAGPASPSHSHSLLLLPVGQPEWSWLRNFPTLSQPINKLLVHCPKFKIKPPNPQCSLADLADLTPGSLPRPWSLPGCSCP